MYTYIYMYTADTSGVNRLASQICHNRFFRKKRQQNLLHMVSTEVSSLATYNTSYLLSAFLSFHDCKLEVHERRASFELVDADKEDCKGPNNR
jgi:hypothetical protein